VALEYETKAQYILLCILYALAFDVVPFGLQQKNGRLVVVVVYRSKVHQAANYNPFSLKRKPPHQIISLNHALKMHPLARQRLHYMTMSMTVYETFFLGRNLWMSSIGIEIVTLSYDYERNEMRSK